MATNHPTPVILSDREVDEVAEMFPHAEYQPDVEAMPLCAFCDGAIDDHKANCVVPHVHALCQTVRALRAEIAELTTYWCQCGHAKDKHGFFSDHDECYECDQASPDLCCEWRPAPRANERDAITALRDQLARAKESLTTISEKEYDIWAFSECRGIAKQALAEIKEQP